MRLFVNCWVIAGLFLVGCANLVRGFSQPIGIDFGPELITAAYAHSLTNVTILAQIRPRHHDDYHVHMVQLREQYWEDRQLGKLYDSELLPILGKVLKKLGSSLLSKATDHLPVLENPTLLSSWACVQNYWALVRDSQFLNQAHATGRYTFDSIVYPAYFKSRNAFDWIMSYVRTENDEPDDFKPAVLKADFVNILIQLKEKALQDHDVDIRNALVAVPEYFSMALRGMLQQAGDEVGIEVYDELPQRTMVSLFHGITTPGVGLPSMRCLALDLGEFYLDFRALHSRRNTRSSVRDGYLPMDPWRSDHIDELLVDRLVRHSENLQFQLSIGADKKDLLPRVRQARYLIRNAIDNEDVQPAANDVYHHDEYPVDLEGWGYQEFYKAEATVSWADVQAVEEGYISSLGENIRTYLAALRQLEENEDKNDATPLKDEEPKDLIPIDVDKVVLVTAGPDGLLLRQAVQKAIGEDVEIVGGRRREFAIAAEASARLAWGIRRRENLSQRKKRYGNASPRDEL